MLAAARRWVLDWEGLSPAQKAVLHDRPVRVPLARAALGTALRPPPMLLSGMAAAAAAEHGREWSGRRSCGYGRGAAAQRPASALSRRSSRVQRARRQQRQHSGGACANEGAAAPRCPSFTLYGRPSARRRRLRGVRRQADGAASRGVADGAHRPTGCAAELDDRTAQPFGSPAAAPSPCFHAHSLAARAPRPHRRACARRRPVCAPRRAPPPSGKSLQLSQMSAVAAKGKVRARACAPHAAGPNGGAWAPHPRGAATRGRDGVGLRAELGPRVRCAPRRARPRS
jgi:hypothetical protein